MFKRLFPLAVVDKPLNVGVSLYLVFECFKEHAVNLHPFGADCRLIKRGDFVAAIVDVFAV